MSVNRFGHQSVVPLLSTAAAAAAPFRPFLASLLYPARVSLRRRLVRFSLAYFHFRLSSRLLLLALFLPLFIPILPHIASLSLTIDRIAVRGPRRRNGLLCAR